MIANVSYNQLVAGNVLPVIITYVSYHETSILLLHNDLHRET